MEGIVVSEDKIFEADKLIETHIGPNIFNFDNLMYIVDEYDKKLPVEIKAVPEGTTVSFGNVLMTVEILIIVFIGYLIT